MIRWMMFFVITLFTATAARAEMVSIDGERVSMRSGPGTRYSVQWELSRGFPLKVLGRQGNWVQVVDFESDRGWVFRKFTGKTPTVIVTKKLVNIRQGPGTKHPVVGTVSYGIILKMLEKSKGWVKVQHPNSLVGWIRKNLLWGW